MNPFRIRIILMMAILLSSCVPLGDNIPTSNTLPSFSSTTPQQTEPVIAPNTSATASDKILEICPDQIPLPKQLPLDGKLLFWEYPKNFVLSFPELAKKEFENTNSTDISISPNSNYLATVNEHFDNQTDTSIPFLEIIDSNDQIVFSIPWDENWTEGSPTWINNEELLLRTNQDNILTIYNPFSDTTKNKVFSLPGEEGMHIVASDPFFNVVAYAYSIYKNPSPFDLNSLRVWNEEKQTEILDLRDEYSTLVSDIDLSNNGKLMVITTVTPNEDKDHSEIIIVDVENDTFSQVSDFRKIFDEILVSDIQWSLDDKIIYLWAAINRGNYELYSLDIQTQQLMHFCFQGLKGTGTQIVWVPNAPEYYFVTDSSKFANSGTEKWDVLLVDSINNISYKVAENISLVGWLISKK